jgi:spoIIIJ-associated protein
MDFVEVEAKTYEEAIKKAAQELNADEKDLEIEVKEINTKGILGLLGSKKVRVIARVRAVPEDPEEFGKKFLIDLLANIGVSLTIKVSKLGDDRVLFSIDSADADVLIGRDGDVLEALQHVVRLAIAKKFKQNLKLLLDVNNFREQRKKTIVVMAKRMAAQVKKGGRPVKTKPLNPYERRIIHTLFKDSNDITTSSEGDGHTKKVIISSTRSGNARR